MEMYGASPEPRRFEPVDLLKWQRGDSRDLICLCHGIESVYSHFIQRNHLCPGYDCPACDLAIGRKYQGYVIVGVGGARGTELRLLRLSGSVVLGLQVGEMKVGTLFTAYCQDTKRPLRIRIGDVQDVKDEAVWPPGRVVRLIHALYGLGEMLPGLDYGDLVTVSQKVAREKLRSILALQVA